MRDPVSTAVGELVFGSIGLSFWYFKMFRDGGSIPASSRLLGKGRVAKNTDAVIVPSISIFLIFGAILEWVIAMEFPLWVRLLLGIPMALCLIMVVIGFLPIKFPNCFYPEWQYAKRHGLLQEEGNVTSSARNRSSGGEESLMNKSLKIRLPSDWRQLSEKERGALGALVLTESISLIAITTGGEGHYVPNLVVTDEVVPAGQSDEAIFADSAQRLAELFPGFLLIDDSEWPLTPEHARLRTGVYILDDLSLTVTQIAWLADHADQENGESGRVLWTATCTCASADFSTVIDSFMEMAPTLEVAS